ncbi:hypothetical protein CTAYLR_002608 [Chrysophaeum taylorii]|uniref:DUF2061 domain-containing protein n=1 Tax=Chrysophaeum taylorii TaxID=2483200 RepID=A0AAD7XIH6_9STRA|nr:hypothetical protein CTAYLR_002608 [Chrysophaeum taylorii]
MLVWVLLGAAHGLAGCRQAMRVPVRMSGVPTITKQRIATRELEIRRLESELREQRQLLVADRRELKLLSESAAPTFRETTLRSLVKAIGWRLLAGFVTFCSSFYFTGQWGTALAIVGGDFITKSGTMFIGERLFNRVKVGRSGSGDNLGRSIVKALIWRLIAFANTLTVSGVVTGSAGTGSKIATFDAVFKTALMVAYDQFWNRIDWGKELENVDGDGI